MKIHEICMKFSRGIRFSPPWGPKIRPGANFQKSAGGPMMRRAMDRALPTASGAKYIRLRLALQFLVTLGGQRGGCAPQLGPSLGTNQPPIRPTNLKIRLPGVFFQAAFDFDAPSPRNTDQKLKD